MILVLQTTVAGQISVWLVQQKKIIAHHNEHVAWHGSDRALVVVDRMLHQQKKTTRQLQKIIVVRGPGSFTAVRTGLIIANTLSTLLNIPAVGIVSKHKLTDDIILRQSAAVGVRGRIIKPWYGKSPNITKAKPRRRQATAKR